MPTTLIITVGRRCCCYCWDRRKPDYPTSVSEWPCWPFINPRSTSAYTCPYITLTECPSVIMHFRATQFARKVTVNFRGQARTPARKIRGGRDYSSTPTSRGKLKEPGKSPVPFLPLPSHFLLCFPLSFPPFLFPPCLPKKKSNLVHFCLKIWHLMATISITILMRINWPNFARCQISGGGGNLKFPRGNSPARLYAL